MTDLKPQRPEGDGEARRRAVEETGRSFIVEASAGTGKTRTLLDRILHLVLEKGPNGPPVPLSRICAITFTEKAAGEMKVRLRQYLEQILLDAAASADYQERAGNALGDLETASISTFHSFAVSLLKERPIEAGLDPRFTALDDIRGELFFREAWEPWINRALTERHPVLEKALRNGFRFQILINLARELRLHWLHVRGLECDPPPSEEQFQAEIESRLRQGREFFQNVINPEDKLAGCLEKALTWLLHPSEDGNALSKPGNAGAGKNWKGGKETVQATKQFLLEVVEFQNRLTDLPKQRLLHEVICWIKDDFMMREWEKRKEESGLLDFDDQLRLARDLLRENKTVRRDFQQQYQTLLVDEFQDTDPIQWEIVLLLSSLDIEEKDIAKLKPEPGRLFIVGDPKQSIYRFRNADIETYLGIVDTHRLKSLELERLKLTTNFRSVPSILRFVDAAFESAMKPAEDACRYQPEYLAFGNHGYRKAESWTPTIHRPGDAEKWVSTVHPESWTPTDQPLGDGEKWVSNVHLLGDVSGASDEGRRTREIVDNEAGRIGRLILEMNGSKDWQIQDAGERNGAGWRAPRYGDIAVLLPVLTHAHVLEEKFRDLGVPYVLEGGKFYYTRNEVSSAILVLRAIANPNDSVALYGSLRSVFFGLSDEDLLRAHIDGLPLDYRAEVPQDSPLFHPYEILSNLHRQRHARRASEILEILLQETGAREVLAMRGFQSLANLNKLGRTLRALQNDATFSQVVDLLGTIDEEGLAESESRLMEERSNAVRIMTIHKAKGLDFPIVFAAAFGLRKAVRSKSVLVDRMVNRIFALNIGSKDSGLQTSRWKDLADEEKKRENAELVRLLYVALTRARDHLILSTHTAGCHKAEGSEIYVPDTEGTRLNPLDSFLADCYSGANALAHLMDGAKLDAKVGASAKAQSPAVMDWESIALRKYKELQTLLANTPASASLKAAGQAVGAADAEERSREDREPETAANRSIRLGVAFHEAMERVDLFAANGLANLAGEVATRHGLDPGSVRLLEAMMRTSLSSELLQQARVAVSCNRRVFRELPFVRPLDSAAIEEGKIDLLFEGEEGWVLVDYKTDWVSEKGDDVGAFFRNKYAAQIRAYTDALRARSIEVAAAYLFLARTGTTVRMA
jgi:ATP-dependent helicase/nuclease subunit A